MRFIIIIKATADSEAGVMPPPALLADDDARLVESRAAAHIGEAVGQVKVGVLLERACKAATDLEAAFVRR